MLPSSHIPVEFFVKKHSEEPAGHASVQLRQGEERLFLLKAKANTIAFWKAAWTDWINTHNNNQAILRILQTLGQTDLKVIASRSDIYTWIKISFALIQILEGEVYYHIAIEHLRQKVFQAWPYEKFFPSEIIEAKWSTLFKRIEQHPKSDKMLEDMSELIASVWDDPEPLIELMLLHPKLDTARLVDFFHESANHLTKRRKKTPHDEVTERRLLHIYGANLFLAEDTSQFGKLVRKLFRLDESVVGESEKSALLQQIAEKMGNVEKLKRVSNFSHNSKTTSRQAALINIISSYFLSHYDIESAIAIWRKAIEQPFPLKWLLWVYDKRTPYFLFIGIIIILGISWKGINTFLVQTHVVIGGIAIIILFTLLVTIVSFIWHKGFAFSNLFLQRLVGATIIGLTVIALTPEGWEMGLCTGIWNWFFITLISFFLAWSFLFFRIYRDSSNSGYNFSAERIPLKEKVFRISSKIFAINGVYTLTITFLVSGLLFQIFKPSAMKACTSMKHNVWISATSFPIWNNFSFGFSPKLILLWASVSMFIGSFVQLLWDEKSPLSE